MRIFEPILGEKANSLRKKQLLTADSLSNMHFVVSGDHTRSIQIATPTVGGLMKFAVKTVTCMGCKTALKPSNSVKSEFSSSRPASLILIARVKMVSYVTIVDQGLGNSTRSKSRRPRRCKYPSRVFGRSVSAVKGHCIKTFFVPARIVPFSTCGRSRRRMLRIRWLF